MAAAKFAKNFICKTCNHRVTVFVSDEQFLGGVSAECANKHKVTVMKEVADGKTGEEE